MRNNRVIALQKCKAFLLYLDMKKYIPYIILGLALIALFYTCSHTEQPTVNLKPNYDSLLIEYNNLQVKNTYNDKLARAKEIEIQDLKKRKPQIKYVYRNGRTEIINNICDSTRILAAYDSLYFHALIDDRIIEQQDTLIELLKVDLKNTDDIVKNRNALIQLNLIELEAEKQAHKVTKKRLNKQRVKTALVGLGGLIGIGGVLYLVR